MKIKILVLSLAVLFLYSCGASRKAVNASGPDAVRVVLDLVNVENDKVKVTVTPPVINTPSIQYRLPKVIPGTYSIANYGRYIEDFQATDGAGNPLAVEQLDTNTWVISQADKLRQITYLVNDTYDSEEGLAFSGSHTIFSPAGTNILAGQNFMLNMCGFTGYFTGMEERPYQIQVMHPPNLYGATAMDDTDASADRDVFSTARYADLVDSPIMYAEPDTADFLIDGMEVLFSIYSPHKKEISAERFGPDIKRMMRAQKNFLGSINKTEKYAILIYITDGSKNDAGGIGALEHNYSTTGVFTQDLKTSDLIDVISHEFFHTLTPLNVHSGEIHYFDFNDPKMSRHLWMYEGVTEYFAHLFQVDQGLISTEEFYTEIGGKITNSKMYLDDLSFTQMSQNVLQPEMEQQYGNVYEKGALIAMCLDIIIRENSGGKEGILDVMAKLARKYGPKRPFEDADLIGDFTRLSYPEVGVFLQKHVVDGVPIDYNSYLARVGLEPATVQVPQMTVFITDNNTKLYLRPDPEGKAIIAAVPDDQNKFYEALGIEDGDRLLEFNGMTVDPTDILGLVIKGHGLEEGSPVEMKVERDGEEMELDGKAQLNYQDGISFKLTDESKRALNAAWLGIGA